MTDFFTFFFHERTKTSKLLRFSLLPKHLITHIAFLIFCLVHLLQIFDPDPNCRTSHMIGDRSRLSSCFFYLWVILKLDFGLLFSFSSIELALYRPPEMKESYKFPSVFVLRREIQDGCVTCLHFCADVLELH